MPRRFAKYNEYHRLGPKPDGTGGQLQDIEQVSKSTNAPSSYYIQADWDSELFGKRFRGNFGVRGYNTDTRSKGRLEHSVSGDNYAYARHGRRERQL